MYLFAHFSQQEISFTRALLTCVRLHFSRASSSLRLTQSAVRTSLSGARNRHHSLRSALRISRVIAVHSCMIRSLARALTAALLQLVSQTMHTLRFLYGSQTSMLANHRGLPGHAMNLSRDVDAFPQVAKHVGPLKHSSRHSFYEAAGNTQTYMRTHVHTRHTHTHTHSNRKKCTHKDTHKDTHTHTLTHAHTHSHRKRRTHAQTKTHISGHTRSTGMEF